MDNLAAKLTKSQEKKLLNRVINKDFLNKNTRIKKIFAREGLKKYSDLMNSYNGYSERSLSSYQGLGSGTHRLIIKHLFEKDLIAKLPYYVVEPELNKTQKYHIRILEKMLSKAKDCPTKTNLGTIKLEGQNKELSIGRKYYYIDNKPYSAERESLLKICEENPDKIEPIAESFAGAISIYKANKECKRLKTYFLNGIN